jgi:hypothetical protein
MPVLKFADLPVASATIVGANPTATVTPSPATVAGIFNDAGTTLAPTTPTTFKVQRAAHVALALAPPVYTTNSALSQDSTKQPQVGQAAPLETVATQATTGGKLYNCLRYVPTWTNSGPNYAIGTSFGYNVSLPYFALATAVTQTTTPVNCAGSTPTGSSVLAGAGQTSGVGVASGSNPLYIGYGASAGNVASVNLDGFFDKGALGSLNFATATFQTTSVSGLYNDSNTALTATKDYAKAQPVTVVNTPYIDSTVGGSGVGFGVTPVGATPAVTLAFTSVTGPGITTASVSSSTAGLTMPTGTSVYPPDGGISRALYQTGKTPTIYSVPTTATVPTPSTNPTTLCVTQASGLPDVFVKPERVLLWVLQDPTGATGPGTGYGIVPNITAATTYGSGDITSSVSPTGGGSYVAQPTTAIPQVPQAQPAQVCGQVNGLSTSPGTAASAAPVPSTTTTSAFAVLEPVNFPPVVSLAGVSFQTSQGASTGKGVAVNVNTVSNLLLGSGKTYDYNYQDPCYTPTRGKCDDNPYLNEWIFSGAGSQPIGPAPAANPGSTFNSIAVAAGSELFVAVADQSIWADSNTLPPTTSTSAIAGGGIATVTVPPPSPPQTTAGFVPGMSILVDGGTSLSEMVVVRTATATTFTASFVNSHLAGATLVSPFGREGGFLQSGTNLASGNLPTCDPGLASSSYVPASPICSTAGPLSVSTVNAPQTYVKGGTSGSATYLFGNVGAIGTTGTGTSTNISGDLISLPAPSNPTAASPQNPSTTSLNAIAAGQAISVTPASMAGISVGQGILVDFGTSAVETVFVLSSTANSFTANFVNAHSAGASLSIIAAATVTAGQSAGFSWAWLPNQPATGTYTLTCYEVDAATLSVETAPPAGFCNLPANYVFGASPAQTAPTIYVVTNGSLNARNTPPAVWGGAGGVILALLLPLFLVRRGRRLRRQLHLMLLLLVLAGVASLSGCGAGFVSPVLPVTPPGTYYFRAAATSGSTTIATAPFEVIVLKGD